ncbi:MAG: TonB family protein, partial [Nitrospirota bacterium]
PQVDLTGRTLQVVIKFRLDRSGVVSNVSVEKTSGNEYYDVAGTRAVLSANPLPPFPREMSDANLDAHFSFTVGEESG